MAWLRMQTVQVDPSRISAAVALNDEINTAIGHPPGLRRALAAHAAGQVVIGSVWDTQSQAEAGWAAQLSDALREKIQGLGWQPGPVQVMEIFNEIITAGQTSA
jgi:hypothetical protein